MKVHFLTSRPSLGEDIKTVRKIIKIIKDSGHSLVRDWVEEEYSRIKRPQVSPADWSDIHTENLGAIAKADVVIAETSYENFAVGYLIAMAVQQKKPILLLRHDTADKNAFVIGVENGWIAREEYDDNNLERILNKFLDDNDIKAKDMRFNFFIDRPIYNYLRWAAFRTGKTKAEILRELVAREIDKANDVHH